MRKTVAQVDFRESVTSCYPVDAPPRILRAFSLATSARASSASSTDRNFITPRGYTRGARAQYLAQCRRNRSNPSPREAFTGAAFISSPERYFSTANLLILQVEVLFQSLGVRAIHGTRVARLEMLSPHSFEPDGPGCVDFHSVVRAQPESSWSTTARRMSSKMVFAGDG